MKVSFSSRIHRYINLVNSNKLNVEEESLLSFHILIYCLFYSHNDVDWLCMDILVLDRMWTAEYDVTPCGCVVGSNNSQLIGNFAGCMYACTMVVTF